MANVIGGVAMFLYLILNWIMIWNIFVKAGRPGWYIFVPFLNSWQELAIVDLPGWLIFIPLVGPIMMVIARIRWCSYVGLGFGYKVLMVFIPCIPLACIAFNPYLEWNYGE